jgi:hypothetical protein
MKRFGLFVALFMAPLLISQATAADSVVVVLDASGSMEDRMKTSDGKTVTRMEAAKTVLTTALLNQPEGTNVGIVVFPYQDWVYKLGPVEPTQLRAAIAGIQPSGGTPLGQYMKVGVDALLDARKKNPYGTHRLLIVTDGEANDSYDVTTNMDLILVRGIVVNTIGVDMAKDHQLAVKSHSYANAADPNALLKSVRTALSAEITANDPDAQEMFATIGLLPDASVTTFLTSLTAVQNQPLGESPPVQAVDVETGEPVVDAEGNPVMVPAPAAEEGGVSVIWILLGMAAVGFVVFLIAKGNGCC